MNFTTGLCFNFARQKINAANDNRYTSIMGLFEKAFFTVLPQLINLPFFLIFTWQQQTFSWFVSLLLDGIN